MSARVEPTMVPSPVARYRRMMASCISAKGGGTSMFTFRRSSCTRVYPKTRHAMAFTPWMTPRSRDVAPTCTIATLSACTSTFSGAKKVTPNEVVMEAPLCTSSFAFCSSMRSASAATAAPFSMLFTMHRWYCAYRRSAMTDCGSSLNSSVKAASARSDATDHVVDAVSSTCTAGCCSSSSAKKAACAAAALEQARRTSARYFSNDTRLSADDTPLPATDSARARAAYTWKATSSAGARRCACSRCPSCTLRSTNSPAYVPINSCSRADDGKRATASCNTCTNAMAASGARLRCTSTARVGPSI